MATTKDLKMVFTLANGSTTTLSLRNPKSTLTQSQVDTVAANMVTKQAIIVGGSLIDELKEAYTYETERIELE